MPIDRRFFGVPPFKRIPVDNDLIPWGFLREEGGFIRDSRKTENDTFTNVKDVNKT